MGHGAWVVNHKKSAPAQLEQERMGLVLGERLS